MPEGQQNGVSLQQKGNMKLNYSVIRLPWTSLPHVINCKCHWTILHLIHATYICVFSLTVSHLSCSLSFRNNLAEYFLYAQ